MNASTIAISRHCTHCDTALAEDARFCVECGASLANQRTAPAEPRTQRLGPRCRACGCANPGHAAFCVLCGSALGAAPVTPMIAGSADIQPIYITNAVHEPVSLLVRALWFLFIGLWLGPLWIVCGWLLNLTLIGLPLGLWMLNRTGHIMTLRTTPARAVPTLSQSSANLLVRGVYFALIGWWISLIWLMLGWFAAATVLGLPVAFLMFERVGTVATLADN